VTADFIEKIFPTLLIILDLCAAIVYLINTKWGHVGYWLAAAVLTFCVTYAMKG